jgi:hypothetical protein
MGFLDTVFRSEAGLTVDVLRLENTGRWFIRPVCFRGAPFRLVPTRFSAAPMKEFAQERFATRLTRLSPRGSDKCLRWTLSAKVPKHLL